ncbi:MAG: phosphoserine transaminase [Acidimicrobiaceae bacterium]|nr:phosphoserine transaminase [Acidimicrobiaceae bacterium]
MVLKSVLSPQSISTASCLDIVIPDAMTPKDGRFGSGPSKFRIEAVQALVERSDGYLGTSHRYDTVRDVVRELRSGFKELFDLPEGYEVALGNGGSTAFWDAASFQLISKKSHHLSFGEFSAKFAVVTTAAPHLDNPSIARAEPGTVLPLTVPDGVDACCYPHNETSTGVSIQPQRVSGFEQTLMLVDATSAAGALRLDPETVDAYYFSPQKALSSDGGLWIALLSPAAIERIEDIAASGRWVPAFLNLKTALDNSRRNQTYNTPSLATLFCTAYQLNWLNRSGGLEWAAKRCERSSQILYDWIEASDLASAFVADPLMRSRVTVTIDFDDRVDAGVLCDVLRSNGIVDINSYRKLERNQIRVGTFPAVEPDDVAALTVCIDYALERLVV